MLLGLCESIQEVYEAQSLPLQSLWFSANIWEHASQSRIVTPVSLQHLFVQILTGPLMVEGIVQPLMKCACGLLQQASSSPTSTGSTTATSSALKAHSSLSASSLVISPMPYESLCQQTAATQTYSVAATTSAATTDVCTTVLATTSAPGFGAWLLIQLFLNCRHARLPIIRCVLFVVTLPLILLLFLMHCLLLLNPLAHTDC